MIYLDIETVPNPAAIQTEAWAKYKAKNGVDDDAAALHPAFGRVACIGWHFDLHGVTMASCGPDEAEILNAFAACADADVVLCGHNIKGFDLPFLACRYLAHGMPLPPPLIVAGKKPWEITHVDTMELLRFGGGAKISLEAACLMVGIPSPKTGRVTSDAVWPAYRDGDFDGIAELCKGDVVATMQLHEKIEAAQRPRPAARRSAPAGR